MLTYCTNIHTGEGWQEVQSGIFAHVPEVQRGLALALGERFPLSIWISGRAARELDEAGADAFAAWCDERGCVVRSINGFPHGAFHGVRVKEEVYLPDWRDPERLAYTERLARWLSRWLPPGERGVISTVPIGFKAAGDDWTEARRRVLAALESLDAAMQQSGREIVLALEPEPACVLETTGEVIDFFERLSLPPERARHLGICFDCCHQAVQFERPASSLARLSEAGVTVAQAHVTCALKARGGELERLAPFSEPVYLHQTVGRRTDGTLVRFADLPQALASGVDGSSIDEWRVHFHVPVFAERLGECETTQPELRELLGALDSLDPSIPLVVETYTFGVLPPELRKDSVAESVVRELQWVREQRASRRDRSRNRP